MHALRLALLRKRIQRIRAALSAPVYNNAKSVLLYKQEDADGKQFRLDQLEEQIGYSTASINNTYLKAQIATGVEGGVIALFVGVLIKEDGVIKWLIVAGVIMNAASIGLLRLVTSYRTYIWDEVAPDYGVRIFKHAYPLSVSRFREKRRRANYNRWTLLRNRRISFAALWFFALPGFVVGMMGWSLVGVTIALVVLALGGWAMRRFLRSSPAPAHPNAPQE